MKIRVWTSAGLKEKWGCVPTNLCPRKRRGYALDGAKEDSLIVDFANKRVGGSCFGERLVQEEQLFLLSNDLAVTIHLQRDTIGPDQAISYEGVYFDATMSRRSAA